MTYTWRDEREIITGEQGAGETSLKIERIGYLEPYTELPTFFFDVLGGYILSGGLLVFVPAIRHPLIPWARAVSIRSDAFEQPQYTTAGDITGYNGLLRYPIAKHPKTGAVGKAKITIEYALPSIDQDTIDNNTGGQGGTGGGGGNDSQQEMAIASETWELGVEHITVPKWYHVFRYSGKGKRTDDWQVELRVPHCETTIVRHRCLDIPYDTTAVLAGTVNQSPFPIGRSALAPPETVLFTGMGANRKLTTAQGFQFYEVTYKFKIRLGHALIVTGHGAPNPTTAVGPITWQMRPNWELAAKLNSAVVWEQLKPPMYDLDELAIDDYTQPNGFVVKGLMHLFRRDAT